MQELGKVIEELGLKILNGVKSGDEEGEVTFIGGKSENCCSVLDLVLILDRGDDDGVKSLKIIKRIESDHLPVVLELNRKNVNNESMVEKSEEEKGLKKAANDDWQERRENSEEIIWSDIKEIIHKAARVSGMSKKPNSGEKRGEFRKKWFNSECKRLRSVVWEKLKNMLKKEHDEVSKKEYAVAKKTFKNAVKKARDDWWGVKKEGNIKSKRHE
ncbi:hypothetical protein KQX54_017043 [Cotesia glomerata]|uniref:Uncharacterized protein n=1 Tax=Cotesia glomerata TaxID=32391 RepID=A0AAV7J8B0_COTGL|nr:hypothetical protein KQX54_017043 [Cotesia glomerata]